MGDLSAKFDTPILGDAVGRRRCYFRKKNVIMKLMVGMEIRVICKIFSRTI